MQTFTVQRRVDAFVNYTAQVVAENADDAAKLACKQDNVIDWHETSTSTFDARAFVTLDNEGMEIETTQQGDF
jgi:hypothetical protein